MLKRENSKLAEIRKNRGSHTGIDFRQDINGLRAYAVIVVLLYHFDISGFSGGFAGVDVFFVISGFLMTSIILPSIGAGRFTLSSFYLARVRRIFPALLIVCLATLVFGWFWLVPYLYEQVGRSAGSSLIFISNFTYNRAGGYFAAPAHDNWLLHTWSVSVEWQFYLLYPLLLLLIKHITSNTTGVFVRNSLWLMLAASLAFCIYLTTKKPSTAFYMLPTRAWELLAGSLVFFYGSKNFSTNTSRILELTGFGLIAITVLFIDSSTPWPGYAATLPVIGTCLILITSRKESLWTCNVIAQALGRWSYSIYLWHWPLVVGSGYFAIRDDWRWTTALITVSIALGALSYTWIEQTSGRWMRAAGTRKSWQFSGVGLVLVFSFAAVAYFDHGVARELRLSQEVLTANGARGDGGSLTKCNTAESRCVLGNGEIRAFVWGDSHAIAAVSGVSDAAQHSSEGGSVLFYGQQSCPVIFDARSSNKDRPEYCRLFNNMVIEKLQQEDRKLPVIIINRVGAYMDPGERLMYFDGQIIEDKSKRHAIFKERMVTSLCRIAALNPVYVLLPIPAMSVAEYHEKNAKIISALHEAEQRCGVHLLNPEPYFCANGTCPGYVDSEPLYSDDNHLSPFGAKKLAPLFLGVWEGK